MADAPMAAVPARLADVTGLPPAFIGLGAIDLFVDKDIGYAHRLIDAGIAAELLVVPDAAIVKQFNAARLRALRQAFSPG